MNIERKIALRVAGPNVEPDRIGQLLELVPTGSVRAGDVLSSQDVAHAAEGWCSFESAPAVGLEQEIDDHAAWLLARLEPKKGVLAELVGRGQRVRLYAFTATRVLGASTIVSAATLRRLAALGVGTAWTTIHTGWPKGVRGRDEVVVALRVEGANVDLHTVRSVVERAGAARSGAPGRHVLDAASAEDFDAQAARMLERFEPHVTVFPSWQTRGWRVWLEIETRTHGNSGGPQVTAATLARLGALGLPVEWRTGFIPVE